MKYNKINLMLPTYKRVKNGKLPRFITSAINNAADLRNICFSFLVNTNDKETQEYFEQPNFIDTNWEIILTGLCKPHLGKFYNQLYNDTAFKGAGTIVSMVGDDMEFLTSGYDLAILNAINKCHGMGIVYCNDDFVQGKKLCVNLFTTRKLVEASRHPFMCELFAAYFIDTVWMEVGKKLGILHYLEDVKIKHHHMSARPANRDETSQRLQAAKVNFTQGYKLVSNYIKPIIKNLRGVV